jgi:hypothetical protein
MTQSSRDLCQQGQFRNLRNRAGRSIGVLIAFSVTAQLLAIPRFVWAKRLSGPVG